MKKLILLLMVLGLFALTGCSLNQIQLTDYYDVEILGVEGRGRARATLDEERLIEKITETAKLDENAADYQEKIGDYLSRIKYDLQPQKDLKNGDSIVLSVEFIQHEEDEVKLAGGQKNFDVKNLGEGEKLNIFDYVDVEFEGVSPNAKIKITNRGKDRFFESLKFEPSKSEGLKEGETVVVKAIYDEIAAMENGYYVTVAEKSYTVEKVDSYVLDPSFLNSDVLDMGADSAQQVINNFAETEKQAIFEATGGKNFNQMENYSYFARLYKTAFIHIKDEAGITENMNVNSLVYMYEIEVKSSQHSSSKYIYAAVYFNNVEQIWSGSILLPATMANVGVWDTSQVKMEEAVLKAPESKFDVMLLELG